MKLREKMKRGPVFGIACFTGASCAIEAIGHWGFDFVYLDLEHTPNSFGPDMERQILAALHAGVSPLVRLTGANEVEIRKILELGAEGVVVPHIRTRADAEICIHAAKFPPLGRRGAEGNVRAAGFAGPGFTWESYIAGQNADTLVIPMAEDFEFLDNLDAILSVPGIDAINFGPLDWALSIGAPIRYRLEEPRIVDAYEKIEARARAAGIGIMCPVVPASPEHLADMVGRGVNMVICGNDMGLLQGALKGVAGDLAPFRATA
jgi:4-hydroxy-2-oxoheptanedioate aldolase